MSASEAAGALLGASRLLSSWRAGTVHRVQAPPGLGLTTEGRQRGTALRPRSVPRFLGRRAVRGRKPPRPPARAGVTRRRGCGSPARARGTGKPRGRVSAAPPPGGCCRRVDKGGGGPSASGSPGAGGASPSVCVPARPPPLPPPRQSRKRRRTRRAASAAAQPADPGKVTATSGPAGSAPGRLLGRPAAAIRGNWRRRERKGVRTRHPAAAAPPPAPEARPRPVARPRLPPRRPRKPAEGGSCASHTPLARR